MTGLIPAPQTLPETLPELARFVLVGREKLVAVRAEIRAIEKVQLAQGVRDQKMEEAQMLSEALLDAEVRLGEMTKLLPKAERARTDLLPDTAVVQTKTKSIADLGFTPKQVERFEILADNQDLVEHVKATARANDSIPTRAQVLNLASARNRQIDDDYDAAGRVTKAIKHILEIDLSEESIIAAQRGSGLGIEDRLISLRFAISHLETLHTKLTNYQRRCKSGAT